jgi:hypothetical protein
VLLNGLDMLVAMKVEDVEIFSDSQLIVQQVNDTSQCLDSELNKNQEECLRLLAQLKNFSINHISREDNAQANESAQQASGYVVKRGKFWVKGRPTKGDVFAIQRHDNGSANGNVLEDKDWRKIIIRCIKEPNEIRDRKVWWQSLRYTLIDDVLYHQTITGVLLNCLSEEEAKIAMGEVHEDMCGTHQSAYKMRWTLRREGMYCSNMLKECFEYFRGYEGCKFGKIQIAPASMLHPMVKPWPFRGWGLDFVGEIHPTSSKGHHFVLVATDYFTKWVEAVPLKNMTHREVIEFMLEHIVYRFGIPQTLTIDQGAAFMSHQFKDFVASLRIKLLNSSPYYAQANRQAEASNKRLIRLIKRKIEEKPRRWHEVLVEALWAYKVSKHGPIKVSLFELVYGQEAMLPVEVKLQAFRVALQDTLQPKNIAA